MERPDKDLVWLHLEIKSPPFSPEAKVEIDADAIVLLAITDKTTRQTPQLALDNCKQRLKDYKSSR